MKSMAVSKIQNGFAMTYENDWTKFFTAGSNVTTVIDVSVRQVENNIFYIYMNVELNVPANSNVQIGTLNLSFFGNKPLTGYLNGQIATNGENRRPVFVQVTASGNITLYNHHQSTAGSITAQGLIVRREV